MAASRRLELWYEFASTYSYLSVMRIEKVAAAAKLEVAWRPFLLGPIFRAQGWNDSPFNLYPAKGRYMWRDLERLAAGYGLPFRKPSVSRATASPPRASRSPPSPRAGAPTGRAPSSPPSSRTTATSATPPCSAACSRRSATTPAPCSRAPSRPRTRRALREQTERAQALGIFGAPSFVVGGELYWGNDRLGDAIAKAALG